MNPTHAGAVVARRRDGRWEFLLIRANSPKREWVLPKGHIERGESADAAAMREVREEAGVVGRIAGVLPALDFGRDVRVAFFSMIAEQQIEPLESRGATWFPIDEALLAAAFDETRMLLRQAAEQVRSS